MSNLVKTFTIIKEMGKESEELYFNNLGDDFQ